MMDDTGENPYDMVRDSVCISAEIQGNLEKRGILGSRTKFWCFLQGSTLYMQKKQSDVLVQLDLRESHQVRRVQGDTTETQFEICIKKKSHVFICQTKEICSSWIKALIGAMALKENKEQNPNFLVNKPENASAPEENVYDCVNDASDTVAVKKGSNQKAECKISDYADPYDVQKSDSQVVENEYYDVKELQMLNAAPEAQSDQIYEYATSERSDRPEETMDEQESYVDAYSMVNKVKSRSCVEGLGTGGDDGETNLGSPTSSMYSDAKTVRDKLQNMPPVDEEKLRNSVRSHRKGSKGEDDNDSAADMRVSIRKGSKSGNDDMEEDEDPFQSLMDALTDRDFPISEFNHPLTQADREPISSLKKYLHDNQAICRTSYSSSSVSEDPVTDLKLYLNNLNLPI